MNFPRLTLLMLPLAALVVWSSGCPSDTPSSPAAPTATPTITSTPTATPTRTATPVAILNLGYLTSLRYVNGTLYGISSSTPSLVRFTDSGSSLSVNYETTLSSPAYYYNHMAVTVNGGNVTFFLSNSSTNKIDVYRDTGSAFAPVTSFGGGGMFWPRGIGIDGSGNVQVGDVNNGSFQIQPFSFNFTTLAATAGTPVNCLADGLSSPGCFVHLGGGAFFVASNNSFSSAKVFHYSGNPLTKGITFGGSGGLSGGSDQLALDPISGDLFVADAPTVKRYTASGTFVSGFDPTSTTTSLAFDGLGNLYVGTVNYLMKIGTPP